MKAEIRSMNPVSTIKALMFVTLAMLMFHMGNANAMYVGNPANPDVIWVPGHCVKGCWHEGYYIQFREPMCRKDLMWVVGQYDRCGNYVPGHWFYKPWYHHHHWRVIKPSCC